MLYRLHGSSCSLTSSTPGRNSRKARKRHTEGIASTQDQRWGTCSMKRRPGDSSTGPGSRGTSIFLPWPLEEDTTPGPSRRSHRPAVFCLITADSKWASCHHMSVYSYDKSRLDSGFNGFFCSFLFHSKVANVVNYQLVHHFSQVVWVPTRLVQTRFNKQTKDMKTLLKD